MLAISRGYQLFRRSSRVSSRLRIVDLNRLSCVRLVINRRLLLLLMRVRDFHRGCRADLERLEFGLAVFRDLLGHGI